MAAKYPELPADHPINIKKSKHSTAPTTIPGSENDVRVPLQLLSRGLDIYVQAYHELHWDAPRPD
ncbi:hypothetical protein CROQUDRAFT_93947 [Cronartium quercuum f. sp. fusiforme G11]|uniref:Uncharacterized protein n=1 Tax=Cronartium quercuum f. sp. fusiforme G11 TaxID=708437 RepID=A0A9P6NKP6_9BASI|nr:hypothetical protein CROQUDRAFT_93947 [Cronartium quercuum f. sp. fusiforme G11]